jgi:glycosyltransferase involved in cell wall biosynthesis
MIPVVSVVVPTHNRRRLLGQALASVLRQRGVGLEVVVVDDGSADGTGEVVAGLRDDRVRLVRHQRPQGVSAARNRGIAEARGSWVAFLDDDDLWAPDKLASQLAAAAAAGAGWAYAGAVEVDPAGRLLGGHPPPSAEELLAGFRRRNLMPAGSSNVVVRAEVLAAAGGFDPGLRHLADWDLWLRLAGLATPAGVPAALVAYRLHAGQATLDTAGMLAEARALEARHGADRTVILRWAGWSHLRAGRRLAALRAYAGAVLAGDAGSLARASVALLHPRPTVARHPRRPPADPAWLAAAQGWLDELLAELPGARPPCRRAPGAHG